MKKKNDELYVFKYGVNAMVNAELKNRTLKAICALYEQGNRILIVHGGGPFIQRALDRAQFASEFIDGQRKTSPAAMKEVETVLKGKVDSELVGCINAMGIKRWGSPERTAKRSWAKSAGTNSFWKMASDAKSLALYLSAP